MHVKRIKCKSLSAPCNILFITWQIVNNGSDNCASNWESPHWVRNTHTQQYGHAGKWKFMLALSWKMFVTVSRLSAIWLDVTRRGEKSQRPVDQCTNRNTDTVPRNMLQFGWPNVCSVCKSQIQNHSLPSWIIHQNLIEVGNATQT